MEFIGRIEDDTILEAVDEIVIYGAGKIGQRIYDNLNSRKINDKVVAFCDGNQRNWGKQICDRDIISVDSALEKYPYATYLIGSLWVREMVEALQQCGIKKIHITRC